MSSRAVSAPPANWPVPGFGELRGPGARRPRSRAARRHAVVTAKGRRAILAVLRRAVGRSRRGADVPTAGPVPPGRVSPAERQLVAEVDAARRGAAIDCRPHSWSRRRRGRRGTRPHGAGRSVARGVARRTGGPTSRSRRHRGPGRASRPRKRASPSATRPPRVPSESLAAVESRTPAVGWSGVPT